MGIGYLKVQLSSADEAFPVPEVEVLVKDSNGNLVKKLITDESGNTETIPLEAPDSYHTLDPYDEGPFYTAYEVHVLPTNGYLGVVIKGVQVYDNETSLLPINMTPVFEPKARFAPVEPIEIPSKIGVQIDDKDLEVDKMELSRSFREVFIPDYITVHLGRPNNDAEDVRVKFADYIKNVASSEIFPTWPESAIRANIYAQITFALNRIFTVWYRSRGYKFDITNSTTVDQAFVYGRNIFQNISNIVDEIFNNYVKRVGRVEPFFTQYCNGTTSTCDGLSQWGTVPLAQAGKTPIEILKTYYPKDIEIVETNKFSSKVETYPGASLKIGSTGDDVRAMQNYLNRIRVNFPAIPVIPNPNGVFDTATSNAVKAFQNTFSLPADGVIGKNTWYNITSTFVAVTKLAELTSEGIRIGIGKVPPTSVLKVGSRGEDVVELQFILNYISTFYPMIPFVIQDGNFSENTKRSVVEFQKEFGLTPDGIVGKGTWDKLYKVYNSANEVIPPTEETIPPIFPGTALRIGSTGNSVLLMQQYLNDISVVYPSIAKLSTDGIFGPKMETSVKAFQNQFGLTPDGVIGKITWDKIVEVRNNNLSGTTNIPFPGTLLKVGSRGSDVELMQKYLNIISTVYPSIPKVVADGIFGEKTKLAVIAFQKQFGLSADGIIGKMTWDKIVSEFNKLNTNKLMTQAIYAQKINNGL